MAERKWQFKPKFRATAYGWRGSRLAISRRKEAVSEIKVAAKSDPVAAGDGAEADANKGKISVTSPIARALIGKNKGDTGEVEVPGGAKTYEVRKVEWLENAPGK